MICGEPQMPAALLIGSNSESFGSKLHATTLSAYSLFRRQINVAGLRQCRGRQ